ncbi:MAG: hypothetical protein DRQ55_08155 [Planctomycetota bacterium]|nr:MAG: hypothetical protein DRQ55_08155 [Planctomycetota bacterium]
MVPTLDGGARWRRCLHALAAQRPALDALVVIDSGSRDGSAEAARDAGAVLLELGSEGFDHGLTRARGAAALPDDLDAIVFLVQDAVPLGDDCLETLAAAALLPGVGAATARQLPPPEAAPVTRATVERSPLACDQPRRSGPFSPEQLAAFNPSRWREVLLLDDVACAVRAPLFASLGFRQASFGEDALLACDLLRAGWAVAHEPRARVEHGHDYTPASVAPRYEQDARFFREQFGLRVRPGLLAAAKGWLAQMLADHHWARAHPQDRSLAMFLDAARLRWAQVAGQRRGSRGPLGAPPDLSPAACRGPRPEQLTLGGQTP